MLGVWAIGALALALRFAFRVILACPDPARDTVGIGIEVDAFGDRGRVAVVLAFVEGDDYRGADFIEMALAAADGSELLRFAMWAIGLPADNAMIDAARPVGIVIRGGGSADLFRPTGRFFDEWDDLLALPWGGSREVPLPRILALEAARRARAVVHIDRALRVLRAR